MNLRILMLLMIATSLQAETITGKVARVIDGDTCVVRSHDRETLSVKRETILKVRLAHIDAPESKQAYGAEATAALSALILGKTVKVEYSKKDRYKRIIGTILLPSASSASPRDINSLMVSSGFAWHYKKYSKDETYSELEANAQQERVGLWSDQDAVAPWVFRKR